MARKFLLSVEAINATGGIHHGNAWMTLEGPLTEEAIREAAQQFRRDCERGMRVVIPPDQVYVISVVLLENALEATFSPAPAIDTLDLVTKLRVILAKPNSGVEAAQLIEAHVAEVVASHLEKEEE